MNPFVDPKKRGVLLPAGCKDLIDVLQRRQGESQFKLPQDLLQQAIKPERIEAGGLAQIPRFVEGLFSSKSPWPTLVITTLDRSMGMELARAGKIYTFCPVLFEPAGENKVRRFFACRGTNPLEEFEVGTAGQTTVVLVFPLPANPANAAETIVSFAREVGRLADDSGLDFVMID